ncbi:MAG: response regulator [Spirochaetaceae bacterium]|nr:response regulator [Spirochaetaceae bacterium]
MRAYSKALIVDDSSTSRMILQRCIDMAGIPVGEYLFAENGLEALNILLSGRQVDIVITDINMPKMDGQTFVRLVKGKTETSGIPIVVVSSIAEASVEEELKALGVAFVVKKPVSPQKMLGALGGEA